MRLTRTRRSPHDYSVPAPYPAADDIAVEPATETGGAPGAAPGHAEVFELRPGASEGDTLLPDQTPDHGFSANRSAPVPPPVPAPPVPAPPGAAAPVAAPRRVRRPRRRPR